MDKHGDVETETSTREPQESTDEEKPVENRTDRAGFEAIHSGDRTGAATADQVTLRRLADEVRRVGERLGYL